MEYGTLLSEFRPSWRGFFGGESTPLSEFDLPEIIEVEPIHFCNFNCIMCHVHFEPQLSRTKLDLDLVAKRLGDPRLAGRWLLIASGYEGTAHPDFAPFVNRMSDSGFKLELTTNGSLLTDKLIGEIRDANFKYVTFSFDGIRKETYEYIREGADHARTLDRIGNFRQALASKDTYFNINYTTLRRNMGETVEAVRYWDGLDIDQVFFIAMRVRPGGGAHSDEAVDDVLDEVVQNLERAAIDVIDNKRRITLASPFFLKSKLARTHPENLVHHIVRSDNPGARVMVNPRSYYQNGAYPGMSVECRSPFKFARIDYTGDVYLCQRFKIGNIAEADFIDIWNGPAAKSVRANVLAGGDLCADCDHFKLCVKADELDVADAQLLQQTVPQIIGDYLDYSIIKVKDQYYGIPSSALYSGAALMSETTFQASEIDQVMRQITDHVRTRA